VATVPAAPRARSWRIQRCFADHCDWRIPNIVELLSIVSAPDRCDASPCIDPAFGPTQASLYWSSSTYADTDLNHAWQVFFGNGGFSHVQKNGTLYARAVRGGP
jgi:hypothetical protein